MFADLTPMDFLKLFVVLIVFITMMGAAIYFVFRTIAKNAGGGWRHLRDRYSADTDDQPPEGSQVSKGQTVQVGNVVAKRCATVGIGPRGLFLKVPWRHAVLIPWGDIRGVDPTTLHWQEAVSLTVGDPPSAKLTFYREDFEPMRAHLPQSKAQTV